MTAMTDVTFILLTFFIMAAQFHPNDAVAIETPTSISSIKVPDKDIMIMSLDRQGKVYFGIDDQRHRIAMLDNMAQAKGIQFSDEEKKTFSLLPNSGLPINQLKAFLALKPEQRAKIR
jgi:biopolymer transport protein ExbD